MGRRGGWIRDYAEEVPSPAALAAKLHRWDVPGENISHALRDARTTLKRPPVDANPIDMANLAHVVGYLEFDGGHVPHAADKFEQARQWAKHVGGYEGVSLTHRIAASDARLSILNGMPDSARMLAPPTWGMGNLTPREQALGWAVHGRALSTMHEEQLTLTAVGNADAAYARKDVASDPPWLGPCDGDAEHEGSMGQILGELSLAGFPRHAGFALQRLQCALYDPEAHRRTRLFSAVTAAEVAYVCLRNRDLALELMDEACAVLDDRNSHSIHSRQATQMLERLDQHVGGDVDLRWKVRYALTLVS